MFKQVQRLTLVAILIAISLFWNNGKVYAVGCTGSGCNGKDPVSMGCSSGAVTVRSATGSGSFGSLRINLRWSSSCVANWTQGVNISGGYYILARVYGGYYSQIVGPASWGSMYTNMANGYATNCAEGGKAPANSDAFDPWVYAGCA